jgi:hypothetical protein
VRQAEAVGGSLLRSGREHGRDHADLTVGGTFGGVEGPSRHALRSQSNGSGGSASRMVTGRSLVAEQGLSPRPALLGIGRADREADLLPPVSAATAVRGDDRDDVGDRRRIDPCRRLANGVGRGSRKRHAVRWDPLDLP